MAAQQTRRILIKVDTSGAQAVRDVSNQLGLLNKTTRNLSGNMGFLTNSFRGFIGYLGIRELAQVADSMQNLENRLKIVTTDGKDSAEVMQELANIARRTYQPVSEVAGAYARMGSALRGTGATTEQLSALTEVLINTFRTAGATTTETSNTMIQLSQAFSSGEVRGQELRSVLEQNAVLAGLLRKEFKGDIFKAAEKGMISAATITRLLSENLGELNQMAMALNPTFEQTVAIAKNDFYLAINALNKELGLSAKFFNAVTYAVDNLRVVLTSIVPLVAVFAGTKLVAMTAALGGITTAFKTLLLLNPYTWAVAAGAGFVYLADRVGGFDNALIYIQHTLNGYAIAMARAAESVDRFFGNTKVADQWKKEREELEKLNEELLKRAGANIEAAQKVAGDRRLEEQKKQLDGLTKVLSKNAKAAKVTIKGELSEINQALLSGALTAEEYNKKLIKFELFKVNKQFAEGAMDVFKYREKLRDLNLEEVSRQFRTGQLTLSQFNAAVAASKLPVLNEQLQAGKISIQEYNKGLGELEDKVRAGSAFQLGVQNYIGSIGTLAQNITKGVEQAFGHLEDNLVEFMKSGKFNFSEFTKAILDDLTRIIVRASIVRPLAQGILSGIGGPSGGGGYGSAGQSYNDTSVMAAKGMGFSSSGNVIPFAKGGIVDSPTGFMFGGGRKGLMGEAGPEAILPLGRDGSGKLGVQASVTPVQINIINQSGANVESAEKSGPNGERVIDVLITRKVNEGIASGMFDRQMSNAYGLSRRGS